MRVLIVEDEVRLATTVQRGLVAEGFSVDVVGNGEDGLWAASEHSYDAVVLDLMLPKLSGYAVVEQLRARGIWTPVLMLTAKDGEYDQADALDLGADDYLVKPFSFVVLVARLRALIRRGAPERPPVLLAGDLSLDPIAHVVSRGLDAIELTAREFNLLHHFMRHRGEVLTKSDILDQVWDSGFQGDVNVVEVYVGYLRRKIDVPFHRRALETIRGVGYRLAADGG
ncbi:MAG: response regulator transcription factor [Candidatus Nanopelagicales bacterium]